MVEAVIESDYRCAPEGHTIIVYPMGQRVFGFVAEMAIRDGYAARLKAPKQKKPAYPDLTK
jgi:hypothetical protein